MWALDRQDLGAAADAIGAAEAHLRLAATALDRAIAAASDDPPDDDDPEDLDAAAVSGDPLAGHLVCPDCGSGCDPCDCGSGSPWIRRPGEPRRIAIAEPAREPIAIATPLGPDDVRPGMRMIGGQWFYSARWL
jgi:hypothetical protein